MTRRGIYVFSEADPGRPVGIIRLGPPNRFMQYNRGERGTQPFEPTSRELREIAEFVDEFKG